VDLLGEVWACSALHIGLGSLAVLRVLRAMPEECSARKGDSGTANRRAWCGEAPALSSLSCYSFHEWETPWRSGTISNLAAYVSLSRSCGATSRQRTIHQHHPSLLGTAQLTSCKRQVLVGDAPVMLLHILSHRYCIPAKQELNGEMFTQYP